MQLSAHFIASRLQCEGIGNSQLIARHFASLEDRVAESLCFSVSESAPESLEILPELILLVPSGYAGPYPEHLFIIPTPNPREAFFKLLLEFHSSEAKEHSAGIHPTAVISEEATLGKDIYIGPHAIVEAGAVVGDSTHISAQVYIGAEVKIGSDCKLYAGVRVLERCVIGNHCIIQANAVIGSDGFGYLPASDGLKRIPHLGIVVLEDNVEIGANTCIDRGVLGATRIKQGVKLDNLIQVAHNVIIGANSVVAAQAGIAGSVTLGDGCMVGGQVGIRDHVQLADYTRIGAQSGISRSVKEPGQDLFGSPAIPASAFKKSAIALKQLPELLKKITNLEARLKKIERKPDANTI